VADASRRMEAIETIGEDSSQFFVITLPLGECYVETVSFYS
jgi:hypothetical protein